MKKRYFAVKKGRKRGVFHQTWNQVRPLVDGYSNAKFKGFDTRKEAETYLGTKQNKEKQFSGRDADTINRKIETVIDKLSEKEVIAFTDGSFNKHTLTAGWGNVIIYKKDNDLHKTKLRGALRNITEIRTRNVLGEVEAVKHAINWAVEHDFSKVTIYHDYNGVAQWALGNWKANLPLTRSYKVFIAERNKDIKIKFIRVPAHINVTYNEEVDREAKKGAGIF